MKEKDKIIGLILGLIIASIGTISSYGYFKWKVSLSNNTISIGNLYKENNNKALDKNNKVKINVITNKDNNVNKNNNKTK